MMYISQAFFANQIPYVLEGSEGQILHTPPPAKGIKSRMDLIINWINSDHNEISESEYIHPLVKSMVLHFCIGFEHPFQDGNG